MQYSRCKCGRITSWGSIGSSKCDGCSDCNTTLAQHPDYHEELMPHDLKIQYNVDTGKPDHYICRSCYRHIKLEDGG